MFDLRGASSSSFYFLPPPLCKATHSIISEHVLVVVHYLYAGATAVASHGRIRNFHNYMQHAICKSPQNAAFAPTLEYVRDDTEVLLQVAIISSRSTSLWTSMCPNVTASISQGNRVSFSEQFMIPLSFPTLVTLLTKTRLFDLAQKTGGIDRPGPRHPVKLLLLLPVEGVQEGPVLQRELPELRRQRVLQHAAGMHAGNRHREVHFSTTLRNVSPLY